MSVDGPFGDLVVVERAGSQAGAQAGKLLADLGARVVKLEPAGGDPARARTADWAWFNTSKSSVVLPPEPHGAAAEVARWTAGADVLIESSAPDPLPPVAPEGGSDDPLDDLVRVRISPFGAHGPYAAWRSTDICDQAVSGHLYLSGDPAREPLQGPADQPALAAGVFAAIGALAAVRVRRRTGRGQLVELTHHEVMAALHQFTELKWTHGGEVLRRMGNRYAGPGSPIGMYRAGDGPLALTVATAAHMEVLLSITGLDHLLERPDVSSIYDVMVDDRILVPPLEGWLSEQTVAEAVDLLQSVRLAAAPVLRMSQLLEDPHLAEREWWTDLAVDGRTVRAPGPPFRVSGHDWRADPAPEPGAGRPDRPARYPAPSASEPGAGRPDRPDRLAQGHGTSSWPEGAAPLAGVRVLDLTRVWAGPLAARILGELGADVVIVEAPWGRTSREVAESYVQASRFFPENRAAPTPWNRNGFINKFALGKRSVSLDIGDGEGRAAFERLVAAADVVIENYSPRVMPNFGLDQDRLLTINPSLVYVTMPGYGRSGPAQHYSAYGPVLDSHAGLSTLMGYPELDAWKCGIAWPDPVAGIHGALATLVALTDRDADPQGRGRVVEVAQFETAVTMIGNRLVEAQLTGHDPPLPGNRHPRWAPQGVYPCAGDDRWVAVSVPDDGAWTALVDEVGLPASWAGWTEEQRRAAHDQIDTALSTWTAEREHREVAGRLQAVGVPAGPVIDGAELVDDSHLAAREAFVELTHPDCGTHPWPRLPVRLDRTPAGLGRPAPLLGEHNREVLTGWAGLSDGELAALEARGVVATEPPG